MIITILAGGLGSRMAHTDRLPKALTPVGDATIIDHIIAGFQFQGYEKFLIAAGYSADQLSEHFKNRNSKIDISVIDTGQNTGSGGRLRNLKNHIKDGFFCMTYCDGLHNVDIKKLEEFHISQKKLVSAVAVHPQIPFGVFDLEDNLVTRMQEKPLLDQFWINAGVFVINSGVLNRNIRSETSWEADILPDLAIKNELAAFKHNGFWKSMDTPKDAMELNQIWEDDQSLWNASSLSSKQ